MAFAFTSLSGNDEFTVSCNRLLSARLTTQIVCALRARGNDATTVSRGIRVAAKTPAEAPAAQRTTNVLVLIVRASRVVYGYKPEARSC